MLTGKILSKPTLILAAFVTFFSLAGRADKPFTAEDKAHWAFQPIKKPSVPAVKNSAWVKNPIDAFIAAELEKKGLAPSEPADKVSLIRRAALDLTGLPPTPEEIDAFVADNSTQAFENVVDRLLLSPRYGERWARHWLDLARYAESEGFKADETRPDAWRYRDYVIRSLNSDKPYDRFLMEQIAGDELWPDEADALVATGFNRHYPDESNARNLMQRRQEILNDITDTVGAVFTGLTFGCARCHDHKFDPILQKDYYRLQAFFANSAAQDNIELVFGEKLKSYKEKLADWEEKTKAIRGRMAELEAPHRRAIINEYVEKYPDEIKAALLKPAKERSPFECQMVAKAELYIKADSHQYIASTAAVAGRLKGKAKEEWDQLNEELKKYSSLHPGKLPIATGIRDLSATAPKTYTLKGGNYDDPRDEVQPGFLTLLKPGPVEPVAFGDRPTTGRRSALARLLVSPDNPLTSRVMVNRIWQHHFGNGIVGTPSDFGLKGDKPTHPELLDWLATEFQARGWSMKSMHKLIMLSSAYQQSSKLNPAAARVDPDDKLLWRYPRHRLEGEVIRDSALALSGLLDPTMGGPSIFPELPPGMDARGGWKVSSKPEERNRRSIYVFVRRNTRYPMFETFDMPDTHESCSRRNVTTSPLQALTMLNNKLSIEWAQNFAGRVLAKAGGDLSTQVKQAYQMAYGRAPEKDELAILQDFFSRQNQIIGTRLAAGEKVAMPATGVPVENKTSAAALVDFCHMLLNSNEFVYLN